MLTTGIGVRIRKAALESISPELVLVDPELARAEKARLIERARLDELVELASVPHVAATRPPDPSFRPAVRLEDRGTQSRVVAPLLRKRLVQVALTSSLFVNGVFLATLVAGKGVSGQVAPAALSVAKPNPASPAPQTTAVAGSPEPLLTSDLSSSPPSSGTSARVSPSPDPSRASVERRLVSLILESPARKLPYSFVDRTTGLVKNNVQVVCRPHVARSFLCVIRLSSQTPNKGLHVLYRPLNGRRGLFTWYGYR